MLSFLQLTPFIRIALALLLGVVFGQWAVVASLFLLGKSFRPIRIYFFIILAGFLLRQISYYSPSVECNKESVSTFVLEKNLRNHTLAKLLKSDDIFYEYSPKVVIELPSKLSDEFNEGDTICAKAYFEPIDIFTTDQTSLLNSLQLQGYKYHTLLYEDSEILLLPLAISSNKSRDWIKQKIDGLSNTEKSDKAILKAIICGDKSEITVKERGLFIKSGTAHILAISGFHLGVIFLILNLLLLNFNEIKALKILKIVIIITFMWLFAIMSGFSPSVVRSVIMLSMFQLSTLFITSRFHAYNIISFAFAMMISLNPAVVWNAGFQLSFMAILSILIFKDKIDKTTQNRPFIAKFLISTIAISLITTIFITPITLYHFGESTLIGIVANIVISALLLPLYIASLLAIFSGSLWAEGVVCSIFDIINSSLSFLNSLDSLYFREVEFDFIDLTLSYALIGLIFIYLNMSPKR